MAARGSFAALLLGAVLAGCAAGGPLPPPEAAPAPPPTIGGADGTPLAVSVWQAERPMAILLALHGYGDYGPSTFADAAAHWAGAGITTYAYDQRGFGRNPSRGYWPGADLLLADLRAVAADLRARHPCLPLVALGHSMGGGVVLGAAPGLPVDGLVLAAPAIWGGEALNPLHRLAAWTAAAMVPERRFTGRGVVRLIPSDNIEAMKKLGRDPLYLSPPSAREIMGLVRITDRAEQAAGKVHIPALLLLGAKDQIAPNARVRDVFARLPGPREVIEYEEGWHLLFRDLQAETVWRDVAGWVLARPAPACGAEVSQ